MKSIFEPVLRKLTFLDVLKALQLSTEAGWNQTADDWRMLIELFPDFCIGVEVDGELVATATLVCYARRLAWIGMVLTQKSFQGRGLAKRLLNEALRLADDLGIETVKLDATDEGQPIYEKLGFRGEQVVERWERPATVGLASAPAISGMSLEGAFSFDERAFGVDRSALLQGLSKRSRLVSAADGYSLARPGRVRNFLGPCVASSRETAHTLVTRTLVEESASGWYWDLLNENEDAVTLAHEFGFAPRRRLLRMIRGREMHVNAESIYALAGFEFG